MKKEEQEELEQDAPEKDGLELITDLAELERERARERELEEKQAAIRAKKRKLIPPFVMLLAGAISSITMFLLHYKSKDMLVILLWVLIAFFIAGEVLKWMLDRFEAQIEAERREAGEVFEKELDEESGVEKLKEPKGAGKAQEKKLSRDDEELIF
ncbi:MAG: hypothetical protein NC312_08175 [Bacteroides fragilis]|nr:hypothetical protein [Bacteroides fragilis]